MPLHPLRLYLPRCHVQGKGCVCVCVCVHGVRVSVCVCPWRGGACVRTGVCAWQRGDSEQPWHRGGHSWVLLVFPMCLFLLPTLQETGAVLQGVHTVLWGGTWRATPWGVFPGCAAHDSPDWAALCCRGALHVPRACHWGYKVENIIGGLVSALVRLWEGPGGVNACRVSYPKCSL